MLKYNYEQVLSDQAEQVNGNYRGVIYMDEKEKENG